MSITGSSSFRRPEDVALVVDLDELAPVGRWAPGRRDGGRLQRLAEVCENLVDGPRFGDERDEPDVATTPRALQRKLLPHPSHEFGL